jgi:hypothetical protein
MFTKYKKTNAFFKNNAQSVCGCPLKTHASKTGEPRTCSAIPTYHISEENRWTCGRHVKKPEIHMEEECSVCLCDITKKQTHKLPCGHVFHKMCMKKWTTRGNNTCPLCRAVYHVPRPRLPVTPIEHYLEPEDLMWAAELLDASIGPDARFSVVESLLTINTVIGPYFQLLIDGTIVTFID